MHAEVSWSERCRGALLLPHLVILHVGMSALLEDLDIHLISVDCASEVEPLRGMEFLAMRICSLHAAQITSALECYAAQTCANQSMHQCAREMRAIMQTSEPMVVHLRAWLPSRPPLLHPARAFLLLPPARAGSPPCDALLLPPYTSACQRHGLGRASRLSTPNHSTNAWRITCRRPDGYTLSRGGAGWRRKSKQHPARPRVG